MEINKILTDARDLIAPRSANGYGISYMCHVHDLNIDGFNVTGYKLEIYGYCNKCRRSAEAASLQIDGMRVNLLKKSSQ